MTEEGKSSRDMRGIEFSILINNINNNIACLHEKELMHVHEFIRMIEKVFSEGFMQKGEETEEHEGRKERGEKSNRIIFCIQDASKLIYL